jgi:hypothetical protein
MIGSQTFKDNKASFIELYFFENNEDFTYRIVDIIIDPNRNTRSENIEDKIREKERCKEFDNEFIQLARNIYITNDKRSQIKNKINSILNSCLTDIKSYEKY